MSITVREARIEDSAIILKFIKELACYEKAEHEVTASEDDIRKSIFSKASNTSALICESHGRAIGFAVYFYNYSTWLGKHGLYLEDLYVQQSERGSGAGKALLKYIAKIAVELGCERMEWSVLDWNEPAIKFYKSLGAEPKTEWVGYRLSGNALLNAAEKG